MYWIIDPILLFLQIHLNFVQVKIQNGKNSVTQKTYELEQGAANDLSESGHLSF